jgi:hypothetical protein
VDTSSDFASIICVQKLWLRELSFVSYIMGVER